jgi:hypothetical protein
VRCAHRAMLARIWSAVFVHTNDTPARLLPKLQKLPILILTAEASYHAPYDHCTVKYLEQAGIHPVWIKLGDVGIHGIGHMMMLERNHLEIAAVMFKWLDKALPSAARKAQ